MQCRVAVRSAVAAAARPVAPARARPFAPALQHQKPQPWRRQAPAATQWRQRAASEEAASESAAASSSAAPEEAPETVYYEGSGSNAELALSLLLGVFVITLPLTIASVGRRLWIKYRFTNKRLVVTTNSPILKREVQIEYSQIKEIRSAPRAFGLWGDIVIFLKDGSRLPLAGLERYQELVDYVYGRMG